MSDSIYGELWTAGGRIPELPEDLLDDFDPLRRENEFVPGDDLSNISNLLLLSPPPPPPPRSESLHPETDLLPARTEDEVSFFPPRHDPFGVDPFGSEAMPIPKPRTTLQRTKTAEQAPEPPRPSGHSRSDSADSFKFVRRLPRDYDGESIDDLSDEDILDAGDGDQPSSCSVEEKPVGVGGGAVLTVVPPRPPPGKSKSGFLYVMDTPQDVVISELKKFITRRQSSRRFLVLDEEKQTLSVFADEKSQVAKRVIPVAVIRDVRPLPPSGPDDRLNKIELLLSPPGFTGSFSATNSRRLYLALRRQEELMEWGHMIMKIIIDRDKAEEGEDEAKQSIGRRLVASIVGGGADKQGWIKIDGVSKKRYFVIIGGLVAYYENIDDFALCLPLHYIDMQLATVKRQPGGGKAGRSLELVTFARRYLLIFDHPEELDAWSEALQKSVADAISAGHNERLLADIRANRSNRFCADCGASDPDWGSLNLGLLVCQWCSGLHRELGANPTSKVRGFKLDTRVWTPNTVRLMTEIGNENANRFWEAHLDKKSNEKARPDWTLDERRQFIVNKYRVKAYADRHPLHSQRHELLKALEGSVQEASLYETMRMLYSFDPELVVDETELVELAKRSGQTLQYEFLQHNALRIAAHPAGRNTSRRSCSRRAIRKGFLLFKCRSVDSEFARRWCILASGMCHFYTEENGTVAKESLDCAEDIVAVFWSGQTTDSAGKEVVSLYTRQRVFDISEWETRNDLLAWFLDFALSCSPDIGAEKMPHQSELAAVGVVEVKRSSFGAWSRHWLCITNNRRLLLFDETSDSHAIEEFDLRMTASPVRDEEGADTDNRAFSLKVTGLARSGTLSPGGLSSTMLYIRAHSAQLTALWKRDLEHAATKSGNNLQDQVLNRESVPLMVAECLNFIIVNGEGVDGVYRLSGTKSKVEALLEEFRRCPQNVHLSRHGWDLHEVTNALKSFLRDLDDPPMTRELHEKWLEVGGYAEHELKLQWYKYYLSKIPQVNYNVLKTLSMHLNSMLRAAAAVVSSTPGHKQQMDINGVASLFAPLLLRGKIDDQTGHGFANTQREIGIVKDMLMYYVWLFDIDEASVAKEERIREAEEKIKHLNQDNEVAKRRSMESILVDQKLKVYVTIDIPGHPEDEMAHIYVTPKMTAQDALNCLKESGKLSSLKSLAMFEVIVHDEVERNLFPVDLLYDVIMGWKYLSEPYCQSVHLRVKPNYIVERLELQYEPDVSMCASVHYAKQGSTKFKQQQLVLQNETVLLHKCRQSSPPIEEWDTKKTIFYHGIASSRKAPCQWGITFLTAANAGESPSGHDAFGHALYFTSRQQLYRWLAAIYYAKYPNDQLFIGFRSGATRPVRAGSQNSR